MLSPDEQACLDTIEKFGCMVMHVMEKEDLPRFSYSVGIKSTHARPEVIVYGLPQELSHSIINNYQERLTSGEVFEPGEFHDGFIGNFPVYFMPVDRKYYAEHFGWNRWLYNGDDFDVMQIVVPTTSGVWPWDANAPTGFIEQQPILGSSPGTLH